MKIRIIAFGLVCICSFLNCEKRLEHMGLERPNVLLLYMDDLRPELGCYGNTYINTPHIDSLSRKGLQFNNAYCNVPVCGASRASMLTGLLPTKNRFLNYNTFVEKETPEAVTLPQLFKNNGYTTISNGKIYHHLDDREGDWDEIWRPYAFEINDQGLAPTDYWQSLWKDYQLPENRVEYRATNTGPAFENADVQDSVYIDRLMTEKVIRDIKKLKHSEKPFFLTAGFISPHLPFNAPKTYWDLYDRNMIRQPNNYNYVPRDAPKISISNWPEMRAYSNIPKTGQVSDSLAVTLIHGYYATVSYVDALIGRILKTLKEQQLDSSTIVILVSDHGYHLQEHTQWAKFTNYDIATQVPLIIFNPIQGHVGTSETLVALVDLYPTLAELCHLKLSEQHLDGKSLVSILKGSKESVNDYILIKRGHGYTLKTTNFSYTEYINPEDNSTLATMLYDHRVDKEENRNVIKHPDYKTDVIRLKGLLRSAFKSNIE